MYLYTRDCNVLLARVKILDNVAGYGDTAATIDNNPSVSPDDWPIMACVKRVNTAGNSRRLTSNNSR